MDEYEKTKIEILKQIQELTLRLSSTKRARDKRRIKTSIDELQQTLVKLDKGLKKVELAEKGIDSNTAITSAISNSVNSISNGVSNFMGGKAGIAKAVSDAKISENRQQQTSDRQATAQTFLSNPMNLGLIAVAILLLRKIF